MQRQALTALSALARLILLRLAPQAAKALEVCLRTIAPKILSWGQYAEAAVNLFQKAVLGRDLPEYVPDFTKCIDHFALHAGVCLCVLA